MFRIPPPYLWTPLSPQRVKGCTPLTIPKMRSKPKNASRFAKRIFWASPVYGSADGVTLSQNFTFCKGVKSAAKQQMGETRKKCNSDDRRLRRIQGGAVGAAVSRTRVPLKARSGRWAPQPVLAKRLAFFRFDFHIGIVKGEQPLTRCGESGVQRQGGGSRNTPPCLWPARSASRLTKRKKLPRATSVRTCLKKTKPNCKRALPAPPARETAIYLFD